VQGRQAKENRREEENQVLDRGGKHRSMIGGSFKHFDAIASRARGGTPFRESIEKQQKKERTALQNFEVKNKAGLAEDLI